MSITTKLPFEEEFHESWLGLRDCWKTPRNYLLAQAIWMTSDRELRVFSESWDEFASCEGCLETGCYTAKLFNYAIELEAEDLDGQFFANMWSNFTECARPGDVDAVSGAEKRLAVAT